MTHRVIIVLTATLLAAALLAACATPAATGPASLPACAPAPQPTPAPQPVSPAVPANLTEVINGFSVADPYRHMETLETAEPWIEARNLETHAYLDALPDRSTFEQLDRFMGIGFVASPKLAPDRIFYLKRDGAAEQGSLYQRRQDKEQILVDVMALDSTGKTQIDWYHPSPSGALVAYGVSRFGDENSTLHLLETNTGALRGDIIPNTRHADMAWLPDESGFYYTRYPEGDAYHRQVYFHSLGADPARDEAVFPFEMAKTDWPILDITPDGRYLAVAVSTGWTANDLYVLDRTKKRWITVAKKFKAQVYGLSPLGRDFVAFTTLDAPRGRLVRIDLKHPEPARWKTLVPQAEGTLEGFEIAAGRLVLAVLKDSISHLYVHDANGALMGEVTLPMPGSLGSLDARPESDTVVMVYNSYLYPPTLMSFSTASAPFAATTVAAVEGAALVKPEGFEVKRVMYPSYDGTFVPLFIVHPKGMVLDGSHPAILDGYGGFGVSMSPYFSRNQLFWLNRGGVYAMANLRGGGELGEAWHKAGVREKKFQVFRDFEYAMRYLLREGYTSVDHLAIRGGSNGGLLMGAMITQAPHLFSCALTSVGLYDMVRYHQFPPGELWADEYGSAANPGDTGYLWAYSPYHQIVPGVSYPAVMATTAQQDTRVHWMHTVKFMAALKAAQKGDAPLLFLMDRDSGHGFGKTKSETAREYADQFKFVMSVIGDPSAPATP